jgi:hypothetical protein
LTGSFSTLPHCIGVKHGSVICFLTRKETEMMLREEVGNGIASTVVAARTAQRALLSSLVCAVLSACSDVTTTPDVSSKAGGDGNSRSATVSATALVTVRGLPQFKSKYRGSRARMEKDRHVGNGKAVQPDVSLDVDPIIPPDEGGGSGGYGPPYNPPNYNSFYTANQTTSMASVLNPDTLISLDPAVISQIVSMLPRVGTCQ